MDRTISMMESSKTPLKSRPMIKNIDDNLFFNTPKTI